jgi:hypothetical protein
MAIGIDRRGKHRGNVDDPTAIPAALGQRIQPDRGIGSAGERPVPEGRNGGIQLLGQVSDLGFGVPLDAQGPDEIIHPTGRDPSQVALGHHGDQGPFGPPSRLQEPVGAVTAPAQLDGQIDGAEARIPAAGPIAIAGVQPLQTALAVAGVAVGTNLGAHQDFGHGLHHLT